MRNILRRAAVAVAVAAASIATVSVPAAHATTAPEFQSPYWAGYWSDSSASVTEAFAQFKVPAVDCSKSRGKKTYMASMWAGIGGTFNGGYGADNRHEAWLEQDGIVISCADKNKNTQPVYRPFWEVVPSVVNTNDPGGAVYYNSAYVQKGDEITAVVLAPGTTDAAVEDAWTFEVTDYNFKTGAIVTWTYRDPRVPQVVYGLSAEAIGECTGGHGCPYLGNGSPVTFDHADYTDVSGDSYSIPGTAAHAAYLVHRGSVAIKPGAPYGDLNDSFNLSYTKNWWR